MTEGAATLMTSIYGMFGAGLHTEQRRTNLLDSGAPHYEVERWAPLKIAELIITNVNVRIAETSPTSRRS